MSTTTHPVEQQVAAGTYALDAIHSSAGFAVEHAGVSTFRGGFKPIQATLVAGSEGLTLEGTVRVEDISVDDENLRPHLLSPEFFDAQRFPEVGFHSTEISGPADDLTVSGELSIAGFSVPVEARGRLRGPVKGPAGSDTISLSLEVVIDRTDYGMNWQMELPGGGSALANQVKLVAELELNKEG
jgi:polyisoprenoid-binding protein YceI